ncbi:MAG: ATP-binding protein [Maribacter sp.]|nr:ATP-binding protein [Maribacter sp.]
MKLSKEEENEVLQVYAIWLTSYLNGDIKTYDSYLDKEYRFIGSTDNEEFLDKKATTNFLKATADQLAGKAEVRNSVKTLEKLGDLVFITDLFDAYFLNGTEWAYYGRFRFTSALRKDKKGWKFVYQHFSTPDAKAQEGETLGTEQITKENQELRDAIKRRTIELEQKTRELQIEASLQRVRAVAMGIRRSEELGAVSEIIFTELKSLGFADLRNTEVIINNDTKETITSYYYSDYGITGKIEIAYTSNETVRKWALEMQKASDAFATVPIKEDEIDAWRKYREEIGYVPDPKLNAASAVFYYSYSSGLGALSISSFSEIAQDQIKTLERFRNVFDLAYRRYADVAQAEAQAREAEIELALERVRSRTMAMQQSDELQEAALLLFQQVEALGLPPFACGFNIWDADKNAATAWMGSVAGLQPSFKTDSSKDVYLPIYEAAQRGESLYVIEQSGKELENHYGYLATIPTFRDIIMENLKRENISIPTFQIIHCAFFSLGYLMFISYEPVNEFYDIFKRFAQVFEQTYTRFLDLQKAEAQAREAEIELALERVRARTMAMQKSDELTDVAAILFNQVNELGIKTWTTGFNVWSDDNNFYEDYVASPEGGFIEPYVVDSTKFAVFTDVSDAKKRGENFYVQYLKGKRLQKAYDYLSQFANKGQIDRILESGFELPSHQYNQFVFGQKVSLMFITYESVPEAHEIFKRFGKVFEQTYTRFLDLQKSEAQAREAEIELALERVRSRTMAMQKSEELKEVIKVVYDQFVQLKILTEHTGFILDYKNREDMLIWLADEHDIPTPQISIPYFDSPHWNSFREAKATGSNFFANLLDFETKNKFYRELFNYIPGIPEESKEFYLTCPGLAGSTVLLDNVGLYIENFSAVPYTEEENHILMRIGNVFQQTYTRFLDLQKAEALAREAQIEVALERVRARMMAMHNSEELREVVGTIFNQLQILGLDAPGSSIIIYNKDLAAEHWMTGFSDSAFPESYKIPYVNHPYFTDLLIAWQNSVPFQEFYFEGDLKIEYAKWCLENSDFKRMPLEFKKEMVTPDRMVISDAFNKYGMIEILGPEPLPEQSISVLKRISKVFEQTYTRFLDLQKAEAQAREAQIEAALERVRSRSMAMHSSNELVDASDVMLAELKKLDIHALRIGICTIDNETEAAEIWSRSEINGKVEKSILGVVPKGVHPIFDEMVQSWKERKPLFSSIRKGKEVKNYYKALSPYLTYPLPQTYNEQEVLLAFFFSEGSLNVVSIDPLQKEEEDIMLRFANVFGQIYRRFLDLQKAEAQAREAQIEAALERVRSRSMAMQKSDELFGVGEVLYRELCQLGIENLTTGYVLFDEKARIGYSHGVNPEDGSIRHIPTGMPHDETPVMKSIVKSWKKREPLLIIKLNEEETIKHQTFIAERSTNFPLTAEKLIAISPKRLKIHTLNFKQGYLLIVGGTLLTEEQQGMAVRFAKVFEQVYTRFLDLQKAEAQTWEAQIETALEKVRSRSLAMHKSDDLGEVITIVIEKLQDLGFYVEDGVALITFTEGSKDLIEWMANPGFASAMNIHLPYFNHPILSNLWKAKNKGEDFFVKRYDADENKSFLNHIFEFTEFKHTPKDIKDYCLAADTYATSIAFQKNTAIFINDYSGLSLSEQEIVILKRFAKVFEQTYTRFLDLQKAEAQAREAQIEAALERVRSRSMAMHKSEELADVIAVVSEQLQQLKIRFDHVSFAINSEAEDYHFWTALYGKPRPFELKVPYLDNPIANRAIEVRAQGLNFYQDTLTPEENREWLEHAFKYNSADYLSAEEKEYVMSRGFSRSFVIMPNIILNVGNYASKPYSDENNEIIKRFAAVFEQSYTRFLDLQKAEAQAREALIETGLERVRAQTMAMNKSEDLQQAVAIIFKELDKLDLKTLRCGIGIINGQNRTVDVWTTTASDAGEDISFSGNESMDVHPLLQGAFAGWEKQQDFYYELIGDDLLAYYNTMGGDNYKLPDAASGTNISAVDRQFYYCTFFPAGGLPFFSEAPFTPELVRVIRRFANAFSLAYKRFEDLKLSEEQAHKAKIEVALERVRARALAMQQPEELLEVAEVLRYEMGLLGVEELETCSIYINDVETKKMECWYALKDIRSKKKKLVSDHFPLDLKDTWVGREMKKFYATTKKQVSIVMKGEVRKEWIHYCEEKSVPLRGYYGDVIPERTYHLYKFTHGAIGAAAAGDISTESWDLLRRAASVFSLAYSRFQDLTKARTDLQKLKTEKQRAEDALLVLKATQTQLIQSEKMASLGELTAGIAHEIQNPLNFVNNFSEVSNELIDEMNEEMEKGDLEEAKAIAVDVKQNLEKILHHGQRADAIVKGMLQHSRSSSGTKEPTDINALCDEYLRLAYHGLRAKDKNFNATLKTDFDTTIGNVNVVPQEMGRVILNLITNAFYAVTEKSSFAKASADKYEPTVWVSTKKNKNQITISVKDNGNGIPQKVLDKIFQPFFTTKPTGQGTGLGLSLSYDIVKAHGGELKVETKEGEGTEFTIIIPLN